jgi:hypothetical protein
MQYLTFPLLIIALLASHSVSAAADDLGRTISVSGQGKATAPPDMATIHSGVVTQASTAAQALDANSEAMTRLIAVLQERNIAAKDIQTSNFQVNPEYKPVPRGQTEPQIGGYRVTNQVRVQVRNLPELGGILDALVKAGSNNLTGISFGIAEPTGILDEARNVAISDARRRARLYAQAAGVRVGRVMTISEQPPSLPRPQMMMARSLAFEQASDVPVATGEQELQATVFVVFELEDDR